MHPHQRGTLREEDFNKGITRYWGRPVNCPLCHYPDPFLKTVSARDVSRVWQGGVSRVYVISFKLSVSLLSISDESTSGTNEVRFMKVMQRVVVYVV